MLSGAYSIRSTDMGGQMLTPSEEGARFRNVWKSNLEEEMYTLMKAAEVYPYIALVNASKTI